MADTVWTRKLQKEICDYLKEGNSIEDSCAIAGIAKRTFYNWIDRGNAGEEPFLHFLYATQRARAEGRRSHVEVIKNANDPKISLEFLWRSDPGNWARIERIKAEHTGADGEPLFPTTKQQIASANPRALELACELDECLITAGDQSSRFCLEGEPGAMDMPEASGLPESPSSPDRNGNGQAPHH